MSDPDDAERERKLARRRAWNFAFADNVPHNRALGIQIEDLGDDWALFRLPYDPRLVGNPETGVLHGGVITTLLDGCSGAAVFSRLPQIQPIATLDLRIDYLRPAEPGKEVRARAHCYHMSRNVAFTRAVAYHDREDDPIASAAGTFMLATKIGNAPRRPA
ncbi:MAG TPA: PaaI family thioesterase [Kofleriaceae bacterium]|nr:PaaI family thioesterase [Kofleriaceae bacterium]